MTSLYVHIPFCRQKCYYCDFLSFPGETHEQFEKYLKYIIKEMSFYKNFHFETLYVGGGTPSIFDENLLENLLLHLDLFTAGSVENTIEVNPESFTERKFEVMLEHGVNRISMGVQTFSDEVLSFLNRPTRSDDIFRSLGLIKKAGFKNFNVDIIIGIQSYDQFLYDLEKAVEFEPAHVSVYLLHISKETRLYEMELNKVFSPLEDAKFVELYNYSCRYLKKLGYVHYEISNFAKPGFESIHNFNYWTYGDYIGVGLGAVSKIGNKRIKNTSNLEEYFLKLDSNKLPQENIESLDDGKQLKERLMLGLRTNLGFEINRIKDGIVRFNGKGLNNFDHFISVLVDNYYAKLQNGRIILTEKGLINSNYIISEIFSLFD